MNRQETDLERAMLADSVRKWADRAYGPAQRAASSGHPDGCMPQRWGEFSEMGWLAVAVPEPDGGLGGTLADLCVVAEELGRALVVEPFVASVVLAGMLMSDVATGEMREEWLPALAEGRRRIAFAPWEAGASGVAAAGTLATADGGRWTLEGEKALAPGLPGADGWIVAARTGAAHAGLFLVARRAAGTELQAHCLYDGRHAATLALRGAPAALLLEGPAPIIEGHARQALDRALVAHCAETVGAMRVAFETTREYLTTRRQFGRPIAANQVIQHRLVDLYVEIEEVRALCRVAASTPVPRLVAALAARTADVARHAWEEAIQLHGAIGMTEEYVLGAYVRRLALASTLYGGTHQHLSRLATLSLTDREGARA